jgi:hypothetical protein
MTVRGVPLLRYVSGLSSSQDGSDPGQQFPQTERLRDIVVSTEFQPDDAVDFVTPMTRDNDHGYVGFRTDFAQ